MKQQATGLSGTAGRAGCFFIKRLTTYTPIGIILQKDTYTLMGIRAKKEGVS